MLLPRHIPIYLGAAVNIDREYLLFIEKARKSLFRVSVLTIRQDARASKAGKFVSTLSDHWINSWEPADLIETE